MNTRSYVRLMDRPNLAFERLAVYSAVGFQGIDERREPPLTRCQTSPTGCYRGPFTKTLTEGVAVSIFRG